MKKRFLAMAMMIMLLMAAVPAGALAETEDPYVPDDFNPSKTVTLTFDEETETLTVSGTGIVTRANLLYQSEWVIVEDDAIKHIVIEEGVESIDGSTFCELANLETVSFPSTLKSIGDAAFTDCKKLKIDPILPKGLEYVGQYAFDNCKPSTAVVIPEGLKSIGINAFRGWDKYDWIFYESDTLPRATKELGYSKSAVERGYADWDYYFSYPSSVAFDKDPTIVVFAGPNSDIVAATTDPSIRIWYNGYGEPMFDELPQLIITDELEGWFEMQGEYRYFENQREVPNGELISGWKKIDGQWKYYRDNKPATGLQELEGYKKGGGTQLNKYFFDENGIMQTGFFRAKSLGIEGDKYDWYFFYEPKEGSSGNPKTTNHGQMVINYYVESPSKGYISPAERAAIDGGKERIYRYYFDENGLMFTGWYNNDMSFDQNGKWRYFIEQGGSPETSRLGRMCRYGMINETLCLGNNGENHSYFFSSTGGMMTGKKVIHGQTVTFNEKGADPETDLLGALIK